jgi:alcohol dehydrogenase class IV
VFFSNMRDFIMKRPYRIVFRRGCVRASGADEIRALGGERVVLMGSARSLSRPSAICLKMALASCVVGVIDRVEEHVPESLVESTAAQVVEWKADLVVVLGGGAPLGLAKALVPAVAALAPACTLLRVVSIPTTYSGSEATGIYGVSKVGGDGQVKKVGGRDSRVRPVLVLYDSTLLQTLPLQLAVPSLFNALAHALEALWAPQRAPLPSMAALASIKAITANLLALKLRPEDGDVLDELLYGAYLAGEALDQEEMALQHRLAHVLGGTFHLPHAQTHMTILPHVLHYNRAALPPEVHAALGEEEDVAGALFDLQCSLVSRHASQPSMLHACHAHLCVCVLCYLAAWKCPNAREPGHEGGRRGGGSRHAALPQGGAQQPGSAPEAGAAGHALAGVQRRAPPSYRIFTAAPPGGESDLRPMDGVSSCPAPCKAFRVMC